MTITTAFTTSDDISNYSVSYDFKQVITPRELTIKLDTTKVYDGTTFVSTYAATGAGYTVTGLQNGATVTAGVVTSSSKDVDTYTYTGTTIPTSGADMTITTAFTTSDDISNYSVSYDFKQVITPRELTIKLDTTKVYDGTTFVSTYAATGAGYTVTGLQNGATVTAGVVTSRAKDVDTYEYTGATAPTSGADMTITTAFTTSDDISNYNVSYDFKQVITKANLLIEINDTKEYDGTAPLTTLYNGSAVTTNGLVTGDALSAGTVTTNDIIVATYTYPATSTITVPFNTTSGISNYEVSYNITQVIYRSDDMTLTCPTAAESSKVYDGTALQPTATATVPDASVVKIEYKTTGSWSETAPSITNVTEGPLTVMVRASNVNYDTVTCTYTLTILPKTITITAVNKTKVYDNDPSTDPALTATLIGVPANGVAPIYSLTREPGQDVGNYTISVSAAAALNPNYSIITPIGIFSITPQQITITADDKSKVYDNDASTDPALTATITGVPTNGVAPVYTLSRVAGQNVGLYPITVTAAAASNPNYIVTTANGMFSITPQAINIAADDKTKVYDNDASTDPALTATVTGVPINGVAPIYTLSRVAGQNVDDYTITVTAAVASNPNYTVTTETGIFSITPQAITIAADDKSKVYDNDATTDPALTATVTGVPTNGVAPVYTLSRVAGQDVDDYTITVTAAAASNPNYTITTETGTFSITPQAITIAADDKTKVYDNDVTTDPALTATLTGVPTNGVAPVYTLSREAGQDVGNYTITVTVAAASNPNYTITTETGTFSITPQAITIAADDKTKVYDNDANTDPTLTATLTGVPTNGVAPVYTLTRVAGQEVGYYTITVTAAAASNPNYTITTETGTFSITPQMITIAADDKTKVYDNDATTDPALTATVTGVPTNGVAPVYTLSRAAGQEVGDYTITVTAVAASNPNYTITTETGTFSITPQAITITADNKSKMYDNDATTDPALTATVTGVPTNGVAPVYTLSRAPGQEVGDYTIRVTAAAASNPNYTVTTIPGLFTIIPISNVVVTIQEHGLEVEYDATPHTLTGYSVSISDPLYQESDFTFSGDATVIETGTENALNVYPMRLHASDFTNINPNFTNVTFVIVDSALYIYPKLKAEYTSTQVFCHNGTNGTATLDVTGGKRINGKYSFAFNGEPAEEFPTPHTYDGLSEGTYSVVVTDSLGYSVTVNVVITEIPELTAEIVTPTDLCPNQGSYPVSVIVNGGTTDYSYSWGGDATHVNGDATEVPQIGTNDGEQVYTVSVNITDAHSCQATATATFTVKPSVEKPGSLTYNCSNDTSITLRYGAVDTLIILNQPTWVSNIPTMPLTLVPEGKPAGDRYAVPEGLEDTTYIVRWHLLDTCGGDLMICTQQITVSYPPCGPVTDFGITYQSVRLGGNCWTRSNLKTPVTPIRNRTRDASNGMYKYNDDDDLFDQYGYLYSWYAACRVPEGDDAATPTVVNGHVRGLCPSGWAIPTVEDYVYMVEAAGGVPYVKIPDSQYWIVGFEGVMPTSTFDAKGAGFYNSRTTYCEGLKAVSRFWTITPTGNSYSGTAVECGVCEGEEIVISPKTNGYSIRCIKVE